MIRDHKPSESATRLRQPGTACGHTDTSNAPEHFHLEAPFETRMLQPTVTVFHHDSSLVGGWSSTAFSKACGTEKSAPGQNLRDKESAILDATPGVWTTMSGRNDAFPRDFVHRFAGSREADNIAAGQLCCLRAPRGILFRYTSVPSTVTAPPKGSNTLRSAGIFRRRLSARGAVHRFCSEGPRTKPQLRRQR